MMPSSSPYDQATYVHRTAVKRAHNIILDKPAIFRQRHVCWLLDAVPWTQFRLFKGLGTTIFDIPHVSACLSWWWWHQYHTLQTQHVFQLVELWLVASWSTGLATCYSSRLADFLTYAAKEAPSHPASKAQSCCWKVNSLMKECVINIIAMFTTWDRVSAGPFSVSRLTK